jgi:hypothetical protein
MEARFWKLRRKLRLNLRLELRQVLLQQIPHGLAFIQKGVQLTSLQEYIQKVLVSAPVCAG